MVQMLIERGEHQEARALCQRLLGERPQSAAVRAAMGDVAGAAGNWNEAVEWYERALELDFDATVMEKLAAARSRVIHSGRGPVTGPSVAVAPPRPAPIERRESPWRRHAPLLIVAAVLAVALLLLFARTVTGVKGVRETAGPASEARHQQAQTPTAPAPVPPADIPPAPTPGARAQITGQAVQTPARYTGEVPPRSLTGPTHQLQPATPIISTQDLRILTRMQMEKWRDGTPLTRRASVAYDSYSGVGILTLHAPSGVDLRGIQEDILQAAYRAALRSMRGDSNLRTMVVRCVATVPVPGGDEMEAVVFRATASRDRFARWLPAEVTATPTLEQIAREILSDVWWDTETLAKSLGGTKPTPNPNSP
jgi:hypothetical protein